MLRCALCRVVGDESVAETSEEGQSAVPALAPWYSGVRARLLLAFFGISSFVVLAAAVGIFAFREVGDQLELIGTRVPLVSSSMEVSRAADRLSRRLQPCSLRPPLRSVTMYRTECGRKSIGLSSG